MKKRLKPGDLIDHPEYGRAAISGWGHDWVVLRSVYEPYDIILHKDRIESLDEYGTDGPR